MVKCDDPAIDVSCEDQRESQRKRGDSAVDKDSNADLVVTPADLALFRNVNVEILRNKFGLGRKKWPALKSDGFTAIADKRIAVASADQRDRLVAPKAVCISLDVAKRELAKDLEDRTLELSAKLAPLHCGLWVGRPNGLWDGLRLG